MKIFKAVVYTSGLRFEIPVAADHMAQALDIVETKSHKIFKSDFTIDNISYIGYSRTNNEQTDIILKSFGHQMEPLQ